ncbi:MAG: Yip1 family protein [Sphingomonadaceae bacterium]
MSNAMGPQPGTPLVERVKAILLRPRDEWPRIDAEATTIGDIYRAHVLPLAAIGPVAGFIGGQLFGMGAFGITYKPPLLAAVGGALFGYVASLVTVYLLALIIDWLAPNFGGQRNKTQAFKAAAYANTAGWVAGIFGLIPALALVALLGAIYGVYLLYLGLPVLMKSPADKAAPYTGVVIVAAIVMSLIISALALPVMALFGGAAMLGQGAATGTVTMPGGGTMDMGKIEEATKKMEAAANRAERGEATPTIAPDVLQGLLPAALPGGLARTSVESASADVAGIGGANAEARYGSGDNEIRLSITDLGAMGGLAALGGAFNVQSSKQTATGYERVGKVDGRMTTEEWDSGSKRGKYATLVGDRIMVSAEGNAASGDAFKAAVAAVDLGRVDALSKQ